MTLPTEQSSQSYTGNDVTTSFSVPFRVQDRSHLRVFTTNASGAETELVENTDYTLTNTTAYLGWSVNLIEPVINYGAPKPLATGLSLTIERVPPFIQGTDLRNAAAISGEGLENALDYLTMLAQRLKTVTDALSTRLTNSVTQMWQQARLMGSTSGHTDLKTDPIAGAGEVTFPAAAAPEIVAYQSWASGLFPTIASLAASAGSSLLGFIQAGAGAVLRTVQSKLREKIFVEDYGAVGDGVTDDHDAIMAAVTAAAGEPVWFRSKTYATSPLVFNGFNGVDLRGWGGWVPRVTVPKLLAIGTTGTLLQFAEDADTSPAWLCKEARVSNLFLEGGGAVDGNGKWVSGGMEHAIIYCQGAILKNVTVRHFSGTGIIQGDMCVDFDGLLDTVNSSFNGGHGLQINPTQSTVMRFQNCSFSGNRLRGINIMGGKSVVWNNVGAQSNDAGGILIHNSIAGSVQIQRHSFTEVYTEANGGPALEISSADAGANNNCPNFLDFKSCAFNPLAGQAAVNISRCYGVSFDNGVLDPYTLGTTIIIGTGAKAIQNWGGHFFPTSTTSDDTTHMTNFRHLAGTQKGIEVQGAWFSSRGRLRCLEFWVNDQAANTIALMETTVPAAFTSPAKGYQMFGPGSIVGITIKKGPIGGGSTGVISVRPLYLAAGSGLATAPTNPVSGSPALTMDVATTVNAKVEYTMDTKRITDTSAILGMELTTPVGYVAGTNKHILVQLWIEE